MGELIDAVLRLVIAGALGDGQGTSLAGKLEAPRGTRAALKALDAFVHEVDALVGQGTLAPEDGRELTEIAQRIGASLRP